MACEQLPCQVFSPCSKALWWLLSHKSGGSLGIWRSWYMRSHKTLGDDPSKNRASDSHPFGDVSLTVRVLRSLVYVCPMSSPCIWSTFNTSNQTNSDVISKHVSDSIKSKHIISHHIISYEHIISNTDTAYIDITSIYDLCMEIQKLRPAKASTPVRSVRASLGPYGGTIAGIHCPFIAGPYFHSDRNTLSSSQHLQHPPQDGAVKYTPKLLWNVSRVYDDLW